MMIITVHGTYHIAEVFKNCNNIAQWEKDSRKTSPEIPKSSSISRKLPIYAVYPDYSDGKFIPSGTNKVLDRLIDIYSIPRTSTAPSGSMSTVT